MEGPNSSQRACSVLPIASEPTGIDLLVALLARARSIHLTRARTLPPSHTHLPACSKAQRAQLRRNGRNSATSRLWPHGLNSPSPMTTTSAPLFRLRADAARQPKARSKKQTQPHRGHQLEARDQMLLEARALKLASMGLLRWGRTDVIVHLVVCALGRRRALSHRKRPLPQPQDPSRHSRRLFRGARYLEVSTRRLVVDEISRKKNLSRRVALVSHHQ